MQECEKEGSRDRRKLSGAARLSLLGISLCLAAAAVQAVWIEPNRLGLERIEIPIWELPEAFEGYRIALLSDLHYPLWMDAAGIRRAVAVANSVHPDLIAITGDLCDQPWWNRSAKVPTLAGLFDHACAPDGVVGVLGNHDHWWDAAGIRRELAENTPVQLIENRSLCIEREGEFLAIGGVGDLMEGIVAPERAFASIPPQVPRILLSHHPDLAERMQARIRVDLQLSGHTHGGQVCLPFSGYAPNVPSRYGNKFRAGLVQGRSHRVYVTRGVCSSHHLRLFCSPEVTAITLRRSTDPHLDPWREK